MASGTLKGDTLVTLCGTTDRNGLSGFTYPAKPEGKIPRSEFGDWAVGERIR